MKYRNLLSKGVGLALVLICAGGAEVSGQTRSTAKEQTIVNETNSYRRSRGRGTLRVNSTLTAAAAAHARDMARLDRMDHELFGKGVADRVRDRGYRYGRVGENIGWQHGFANPEAKMMDWWKNSPGHNANMLNAEFTEIGVGAYRNGDGKWYFCQVFGRPLGGTTTDPDPKIVIESGEVTFYRIGGKEKVTHFVRFRPGQRAEARTTGARQDLDMYVYKPGGGLVVQDRKGTNNPSVDWTAQSSGKYSVTIENYSDRPTAYSLVTNGAVQKGRIGEGGGTSKGKLSTSDASVYAGFLANGAQKRYRERLQAGRTYTITATKASGNLDPILYVRNTSGRTLASNDDGGTGLNSRLTFRPSVTGDYFIDVRSLSGSGNYRLGISD